MASLKWERLKWERAVASLRARRGPVSRSVDPYAECGEQAGCLERRQLQAAGLVVAGIEEVSARATQVGLAQVLPWKRAPVSSQLPKVALDRFASVKSVSRIEQSMKRAREKFTRDNEA